MKSIIQQLQPRLKEIFKHLHEHPEISWEEHETTSFIHSLVENEQCHVRTFEEHSGLVVDIGQGKPIIAVRADIDALWQEVNGTFQANHSCGHDAHMTIVLGALLTLLQMDIKEEGTFRFIFQPAEEKGTGALACVDQGVVDDVDYLFGMHLRPKEELPFGHFAPSIQHGAAQFFEGMIQGVDAHGARPHLNTNAIAVGMELFQHINAININPAIPHSAKLTAFQAGGKSPNIIPGNATFSVDVRAQTNEAIRTIVQKIESICEFLASYHNVTIDLTTTASVAAAVMNEEANEVMRSAIIDTVGEQHVAPISMTTGGDDFHYFTIKRPHLKATMLAIGCDLSPGLHHPHMTFNHAIFPDAIEIVTRAMLRAQQAANE